MKHKSRIKNLIISLIVLGLFLPSFCFGQVAPNTIQTPETIKEAKEIGEEAWKEVEGEMPGILEKLWNERVAPVWKDMWRWIEPRIKDFWQKIQELFGMEIEKRKPIIEQELEREKQEIWERFKELIK